MTPHNRGSKKDFAEVVLFPGDPLRAKYIAENFLEGARLVTDVRGILGYTGKYKEKKVSVMASGMGGPSAGLYAYELFKLYDVGAIIRIGTAGGLREEVKLGSLVFAMSASTDSAWAHQYSLPGTFSPAPSWPLFKAGIESAEALAVPYTAGMIFSSDLYSSYSGLTVKQREKWGKMGALVQEMETYALYSTALFTNKKALSILTVTFDCLKEVGLKGEMSEYDNMISVALETARKSYEL